MEGETESEMRNEREIAEKFIRHSQLDTFATSM